MTTNQTIDGVPRELLQRWLDNAEFFNHLDGMSMSSIDAARKEDEKILEELRALLDVSLADEGECCHEFVPFQPNCTKCGIPYKTAAQPQGELVALTNAQRRAADYKEQQAFNDWAWNKEGEAIGRMDGQAAAIEAWHARAKLAEQPAPVAVVHPFTQKVIRKLERFQECTDDGQGADIGRHWFDLLTQLGLLNRAQRSPALWEMTQQGEDALELSRKNAKSR